MILCGRLSESQKVLFMDNLLPFICYMRQSLLCYSFRPLNFFTSILIFPPLGFILIFSSTPFVLSFILSPFHFLTYSFFHSFTLSIFHLFILSFTFSFSHLFILSFIHSFSDSLFYSFILVFIHSLFSFILLSIGSLMPSCSFMISFFFPRRGCAIWQRSRKRHRRLFGGI